VPVTIRLPASLASLAETPAIETQAVSLGEALLELRDRYPRLAPRVCAASGQPHSFVAFYLNAAPVRIRDGLDSRLADGDEITIVTAIAGG